MMISRPIISVLFLSLIAAFVGTIIAITAAQQALNNVTLIRHSEFNQCMRVQKLRDRVNDNSKALDNIATQLTGAIGENSILLKLSSIDLVNREEEIAVLRADIASLRFIPSTDCHAAVFNPHYRPPVPVPISYP